MVTKRNIIPLIAAALMLGAGCGSDDADGGGNGGGGGGGGGGSVAHPNVDCADADGTELCVVTGEITEDLTIAPADGRTWLLSGPVFVGDDAEETVLTIDAGTTVFADAASNETTFLTVRRGSKIVAEGTAQAPIVFTPSTAEGQRERGLWGGLIINGRAPLNTGAEAQGEGNTGTYGGTDPADSSGVLKYVRVEFAGDLITAENELNGIAFQGVGSGTEVDYVQVHMNSDDGVEFFGGTVNAKHLVLTGIGDDSMDWTDGWQGKVQYLVVQQFDDSGDRGIEADNLEDDPDATPRSHPMISNATFIGGAAGDTGLVLRRGTALNLYNAIIVGFQDACLDIDSQETFDHAWDGSDFSGELTIENSIIDGCAEAFAIDDEEGVTEPFTVEDWFMATGWNNQQVDPMLDGWAPQSGSPALGAGVTPDGSFFEAVDFIGAIGSEDWTEGWTTTAAN